MTIRFGRRDTFSGSAAGRRAIFRSRGGQEQNDNWGFHKPGSYPCWVASLREGFETTRPTATVNTVDIRDTR